MQQVQGCRLAGLLCLNFFLHFYIIGAAAEASKFISFLPNLITEPHVKNAFLASKIACPAGIATFQETLPLLIKHSNSTSLFAEVLVSDCEKHLA